MLNQEPAYAESFGNGLDMLERLVFQGLLYFYRKLSALRFLPGLFRFALTNCPWVSVDAGNSKNVKIFLICLDNEECDTLVKVFRRQHIWGVWKT